ncbi:MAG TPA: aminotransferase class V-fold PLP-dependent enzyme [Micromonosporaceae bacterium]|nr:aminotransferase class V-fold PLP-dependent enzyme [Micromonosporaceae bacterium]
MPTPTSFRSRFPALRDTVHLASCSHGALSDELIGALSEYQHTLRTGGAPWDRWMAEVDTARAMFARVIGADYDEIAVVPSASAGAFQVASTQDWSDRPRLVTTDVEFPSIAQVWLAQAPTGVDVVHVAARDGVVHAEDYLDAVNDQTGLVSIPLVSYRNGMRLPTADVVAKARAMGISTVVDAYQGAGVVPIDVHDLDCDYLISGTLKYMLGIPGLAFLYVRAGLVDAISPIQTGWFGRVNPYEFNPHRVDYPAHARRFESGTPSIPAAFGAVAGMRVLETLDAIEVTAHIADLGDLLDDSLRAAGEHIASPAEAKLRGPMVAVRDGDPVRLAAYLRSQHIETSPRGDAVRLSLHFYNTQDDVVAVADAIREYRRH